MRISAAQYTLSNNISAGGGGGEGVTKRRGPQWKPANRIPEDQDPVRYNNFCKPPAPILEGGMRLKDP